jgi:predicted membrane channel-forming protein YqfA (hemolysin III family)
MSSVFNYILYLPAAALVFVFALVLVTKFQPYKQKRNNTVDIILLLTIVSAYTSSSMYYAEPFMYPRLLNEITVGISVLIVFSYPAFLNEQN